MKNKGTTDLQQKLRNYILKELSLLPKGQPLLKELELAQKYSVGRNTVRKVLYSLEEESLVIRIRGKGTFSTDNQLSCHMKRNPFRKIKIIFGLGLGGASPFYNELLVSVIHKAQKQNYHVEVSSIEHLRNKKNFCLDSLKDPFLEGLLLVAVTQKDIIQALFESKMPICILDHYTDLPIDTVDIANYKGSYDMTQRLITLGHERIFYVNAKPNHLNPDRLKGYLDCMADNGIKVMKEWVLNCLPYEKGGRHAAEMILNLPRAMRPTAVYFFASTMAIEFLKIALEKGIRVPSEMSVCSNGEIPNTSSFETNNSKLTFNRFEGKQVGRKGFQLLLDRIQEPSLPNRQVLIKAKTVLGSSIGPNRF